MTIADRQVLPAPAPERSLAAATAACATDIALTAADRDMVALGELSATPGLLEAWLAAEVEVEPEMEPRTRAAYLLGRLAWTLGSLLAPLHLSSLRIPLLTAADIRLDHERYRWSFDGLSGEAIRYRIALAPAAAAQSVGAGTLPAAALRELIEDLHAPLIQRLAALTGLSRGAQWRLVADAVADTFLAAGQRLGCEARAMASADEMLHAPGSPLRNRQTGFVEVSLPDPRRRDARLASAWFRVRGGCCRYYTLPEGEYCTTCVLRPPADREALLREHLRAQLVAAS